MKSKNEKLDYEEEFQTNPTNLTGVPDLCMLKYSTRKNILFNFEHRYCKMARKMPYNFHSISNMLISINPWERLPIYGQDVIDEFHEAQGKRINLLTTRPHPYGVSAQMYASLVKKRHNQCAIISGVSGSGKTETCKLLIRYLAMTAPSCDAFSTVIEQQIIATTPILEAFGNAKTILNYNASCYCKYIKLLYDVPTKGRLAYIVGSVSETYLLQTSRVVFQSRNERTFHIPYFLHKGIPQEKHALYGIDNLQYLQYTNQGGCPEVPGISDRIRFQELQESFTIIRINEDTQCDLWKIVCGVFNLGNISFKRLEDGSAIVNEKRQVYIDTVAGLWSVDSNALVGALTTRSVTVMKKVVQQNIQFDCVQSNRDSIAKNIYQKIFVYLCERINAELFSLAEDDVDKSLFIGILDAFGFGNFWINSLEQFCVNYMNEKLHQLMTGFYWDLNDDNKFLKSLFEKCPKVYNPTLIEMFENKQNGVFSLLNIECKQPQPAVDRFMQQLCKVHADNGIIKKCKKHGSGNVVGRPQARRRKGSNRKSYFVGFEIKHFADDVCYDASKFLLKNKEIMNATAVKMFKKSTSVLLKSIIGSLKISKKKGNTMTLLFKKNIDKLFDELLSTELHLIQCINPNSCKESRIWTEAVVEHELRCCFGYIKTWGKYQMVVNSHVTHGFVHQFEQIEWKQYKIPPDIITIIQMFYITNFVR
eukprot:499280_1